ncbi:hypothetical protein AAEY27_00435 [Kosakonia sp. BYX6]|uniref:Contractile injection system tube protein N-terminal domain-containing protein n=1 Tax=Kosakonia calanthes TaxID=3139408 RepID=A0ABZ3B6B1_9ENTR
MSLLDRSLAKLTISAWKDREGKIPAGKMQVMYNPESIQLDYQTRYSTEETINKSVQTNRYVISEPSGLGLNLLFDADLPGNSTSIESQMEMLKFLCAVDASTDTPHFLQITWGNMRWENKGYFAGRASELSINYTLFDRNAAPLRATARLLLVADASIVIQNAEKQLLSPTSTLLNIADKATLALMAVSAAASLAANIDYLSLAWQNDMDNLDDFSIGGSLLVQTGAGNE